jgi:predicted MFS family arabinose efflux permease
MQSTIEPTVAPAVHDEAQEESSPPSKVSAYSWYALALLTGLYAVNLIDRGIFSGVVEPIKAEFHLSDSQIGAITGIAFGATYALGGLPMGMLADRVNRKRMLVVVGVIWSVLTLMASQTRSFATLFAARMGVGFAESGGSPPTMSMVADLFPPGMRPKAMSFFVFGTPIGAGVAFAIAALVAPRFGWRAALLVAGLPGLVLAALILFTFRNPLRGATEPHSRAQPGPAASLQATFSYFVAGRALKRVFFGTFLLVFGSAGMAVWLVSFLMREHGFGLRDAALLLSLATGGGGLVGLAVAAPIVDRFSRAEPRRLMILAGIAVSLTAIASLVTLLSPNRAIAIAGLISFGVVQLVYSGLAYASVLNLCTSRIRGTMIAALQICANFFGSGLGPWTAGVVSQAVGGPHSLRWGLTVEVVAMIASAACFFLAAHDFEADLQQARVAEEML